jgi:hypothetical protein
MGPKKRKLNDGNQKTLLGFIQSSTYTESNTISSNDNLSSNNVSTDIGGDNAIEINSESGTKSPDHVPKKIRKYNKDWEKLFCWLAFDEKTNSMYCILCTNAKKKQMEWCKVLSAQIFNNQH